MTRTSPGDLLQRPSGRQLERLGNRQRAVRVAVAVLELDARATVVGRQEADVLSTVAQRFVDSAGGGDLLEHVGRRAAPARDDVQRRIEWRHAGREGGGVLGA